MFPPSSPNTNPTGSGVVPTNPMPIVPPYTFNGWTISPPNILSKGQQVTAMQNLFTKLSTDMLTYMSAIAAYDNASAIVDGLKATKDADQAILDNATAAFNSYVAPLMPGNITPQQQTQIDTLSGAVITAALNLGLANQAYTNGLASLSQYEANVNTAKGIVAQDISLMSNTWANVPSKMPYVSFPTIGSNP